MKTRLLSIVIVTAAFAIDVAGITASFSTGNGGELTIDLSQDIVANATGDIDATIIFVLKDVFTAPQVAANIQDFDPFTLSRTGTGNLPNVTSTPGGYDAATFGDVTPSDFFIELGTIEFSDGDSLTIVQGSISSQAAWLGTAPNAPGPYGAFFADQNGTLINNLVIIPESNSGPWLLMFLFGFVVMMHLKPRTQCYRGRKP